MRLGMSMFGFGGGGDKQKDFSEPIWEWPTLKDATGLVMAGCMKNTFNIASSSDFAEALEVNQRKASCTLLGVYAGWNF